MGLECHYSSRPYNLTQHVRKLQLKPRKILNQCRREPQWKQEFNTTGTIISSSSVI